MNTYITHALREFRAAGWSNENGEFDDEMQKAICDHVMALLEVFADEGHSGSSASYAIDLFEKLARFEPIAPLTGDDWEWTLLKDGSTDGVSVHQNKRCSHVFKQSDHFDGQAYDINGIVFWEWYTDEYGDKHKTHYTSGDSFVPIEFPYTPKTEYVYKESASS